MFTTCDPLGKGDLWPVPHAHAHLRGQRIPLINVMGPVTCFEGKSFFDILEKFWPLRKTFGGFSGKLYPLP